MVDETSLKSVVEDAALGHPNESTGHVILVQRDWRSTSLPDPTGYVPVGYLEEQLRGEFYDPLEGNREEHVGWMMVKTYGAMVVIHNRLRDSSS
jgi:hypothetical protein